MIRENIKQRITELARQSNRDELLWISGYVAGLAGGHIAHPAADSPLMDMPVNGSAAITTATVIYGTETGNAKKIATQVAALLKQQKIVVKLVDAAQYKVENLAKEKNLLIIISTQGDGEPPLAAKPFYDYLKSGTAALHGTNYAVLALGSTAYPLFCQTGIEVDEWLKRSGAKALLPLVKCDEDFDAEVNTWIADLQQLTRSAAQPAAQTVVKKGKAKVRAEVTFNILLNDEGSRRQTHHIELKLLDQFAYTPGDAVGIYPHNSAHAVQQIIALSGMAADYAIRYKEEEYVLSDLLRYKLCIVHLSLRTIDKYATLTGYDIPETRMDLYDLLRIYPVKNTEQFIAAVGLLDAIAPRLYTLSSSPAAHEGELHLTVLRLPVMHEEKTNYGLCSDYLSQLEAGTVVDVFLHQHKHFQLPPHHADIVMIGPGTGIAPFRSFIAERDVAGASGKNWLFFGEKDFVTDFYYQTELQAWHDTGVLHNIDLAWEHGPGEIKTVTDALLLQAEELWQWINSGAYIMISGEKDPMSKAVEDALLTIAQQQGGHDEASAALWLKQLSKEGRYAKDVY